VTEVAELAGLYKNIHAHPELAFAEHRTAASSRPGCAPA
jgi:metal-dependent amidase/aminoacylase/carboxypeptidase family protein